MTAAVMTQAADRCTENRQKKVISDKNHMFFADPVEKNKKIFCVMH